MATHLPIVGTSVDVVRRVATTADYLARAVLPGALQTARTLEPEKVRRPDGTIDVALLQNAGSPLADLSARVHQARLAADAWPATGLVGAAQRARTDMSGQVAQLDDALRAASQAVQLAPPLLGADRPRRYFLMVQQTSESRGTGGIPAGYAVIQADKGRVTVLREGTDADLPARAVKPPPGVPQDYIDLYRGNDTFFYWQNVNLSPNLPVVARVVTARWKQQTGQSVDAVIALDALALADLLRGSPPLDIGGRKVAVGSLPEFLAVGQYVGLPPDSLAHRNRKERLAAVAKLASQRVTGGQSDPKDLLEGLVDAVRSGHLKMASDDPALTGLHQAGVDGAFPPAPAPFVQPVVVNATAGKLDYFLDRAAAVSTRCAGGRRRNTLTLDLRNAAPRTGLPPYLTIRLDERARATQSSVNALGLSVYATRGANLRLMTLDKVPLGFARLTSVPFVNVATDDGVPVWTTYFDLAAGQTRRVVVEYDEPLSAAASRVVEQPLARPLRAASTVQGCG